MTADIPGQSDWGDASINLDVRDAHRVFSGKSNQEMQSYFRRDVMARAQDLRFMPMAPFLYYIRGFCDFVLSGSYGDQHPSDVADCFMGVIKDRIQEQPETVIASGEIILNSLDYLADHQTEFGASLEIYGSFREQTDMIKRVLGRSVGS